MKYCKIILADADTGELIYETKATSFDSSYYIRNKILKNIESFSRYINDNNNDVVLQILVREQRKSLDIPFEKIGDVF